MVESRSRAAQLYGEYGPVVYRRCLRLLRDPEAAKDATQEVFMKLLGNMERLADRETVLPWIFRVATNHCLNLRRNTSRRGEHLGERRGQEGEGAEAADLEIAAGPPQDLYPDRALVQGLLSRFDAATQTVAVGVLVDGMEHEEVALMLGISRRTVARKLERFLENAKKILTRSES